VSGVVNLSRRRFLFAASTANVLPWKLQAQAKSLHLKITGLKTFVVNQGGVNWVFCKIATDQGLTGLGEGSVTSKELTLAQAILEHERFLLGKGSRPISSFCGRRCSACRAGAAVPS
jgi:L-alanine-DL-glutamate epimerase-like enolase superfamily enzyme